MGGDFAGDPLKCIFTARIRPNLKVIETAMRQLQKAAILDKTAEKIAYLGGLFF